MKWCISVLTRGYPENASYSTLIKRNVAIHRHAYSHLAPLQLPDVVVFHEGNISGDQQAYIQSHTPDMPLVFKSVEAEFRGAAGKMESKWCRATPLSDSFSIGYKHMCRFWFGTFFKYLEPYDYICRIDEDCFLREKTRCLYQCIKSTSANYISACQMTWSDDPAVTMGIEALAKSEGFAGTISPPLPYTNFFIVDAKFYRASAEFQKWVRAVEESNGIYVNRWGDLPLWGMVLSCGIGSWCVDKRVIYDHDSHGLRLNDDGCDVARY